MDNWKKELKKKAFIRSSLDGKTKFIDVYELESFIEKAIIEAKIGAYKELQGIAGIQGDKIIYRKLKQLTCKHDGRTEPDPLGGIFCVECSCFVDKEKLEQLKKQA